MAAPFDRAPYRYQWIQEFDAPLHVSTANHEGRSIIQFTMQITAKEYPYMFLLPSHKQLICISTTHYIYICNPSTRDFIELPKVRRYSITSTKWILDIFLLQWSTRLLFNCLSGTLIDEDCPYAVEEFGSVTVYGFVIWPDEESLILSEEEDDEYIACVLQFRNRKVWVCATAAFLSQGGIWILVGELKGNLWYVDYGDGPLIMNMWILKDWNAFEWKKQYSGPGGLVWTEAIGHYSTRRR